MAIAPIPQFEYERNVGEYTGSGPYAVYVPPSINPRLGRIYVNPETGMPWSRQSDTRVTPILGVPAAAASALQNRQLSATPREVDLGLKV